MAPQPVSLLSLATALPPHRIDQSAVAQVAHRIYGRAFARYPKLADVYRNAGIEQRYSVRPLDWFMEPRGWPERTQAYLEGAGALFVKAAQGALDRAGISGRDVDVIITISSTGIATPSLEARVGAELGFKAGATACAGVRAWLRWRRGRPGARHTACSCGAWRNRACRRGRDQYARLSQRSRQQSGCDFVGVVRRWRRRLRAAPGAERTKPGRAADRHGRGAHLAHTLDIMGWTVDPAGLGVVLSRSLPRFLEQRLAAPMRRFVKTARLNAPQFVCHPGGAKVLEAVESALKLQKGTLRDEREVLRAHGNMSSPSVLFVLDRALKRGLRGSAMLAALGPGFTASFLALEAA